MPCHRGLHGYLRAEAELEPSVLPYPLSYLLHHRTVVLLEIWTALCLPQRKLRLSLFCVLLILMWWTATLNVSGMSDWPGLLPRNWWANKKGNQRQRFFGSTQSERFGRRRWEIWMTPISLFTSKTLKCFRFRRHCFMSVVCQILAQTIWHFLSLC